MFLDFLANMIDNHRLASLTLRSEHPLKDLTYVTWHNK